MNVSTKEFIMDIPELHPLTQEYVNFWREQKKRCIEGFWVGGYYMPPTLYFYVNFGKIRMESKGNARAFNRPLLRDIEWLFFRHYTEARGFSGFADDDICSCNRLLLEEGMPDEYLPDSCFFLGKRKKYIPASEYLEMQHPRHYAFPLYENDAKNVMLMGSRSIGKSFMVSIGIVLHQFTFDNKTSVDQYVSSDTVTEIVVGGEEAKFSNDILRKSKEALDFIPGKTVVNGRTYPSPFSKQYMGSWNSGGEVIAKYKVKTPGGWEDRGSRSSIKNRTFKDNPFAAQGTRPTVLILEECGLFSNLREVYANTVDNLRPDGRKTGSLIMLGTGGDMDRGTIPASEMFFDPDRFDILPIKDQWENVGNRIGFFVPATLSLKRFKNEEGFTDIERAKLSILKEREELSKGNGGSDELSKYIQYRPLVPSEMFLSKSANVFPTVELRKRLSQVQQQNLYQLLEKKVDLYFDPNSPYNGVNYEINNKLNPISKFPWDSDDREGAVVIYEFPYLDPTTGKVPSGAYIIGCDPYKDDSATGASLAAIYVMKTNKYFNTVGHNEIVASYIGRPYLGKNQVNETLFKLSSFYGNATIYFESAVGNVKDYFEKIRRLDLLARKPITLFNKKASYDTGPMVEYGYPMPNDKVKWEALQYLRSWLLEVRREDEEGFTRNLDYIVDVGLLQELISFTMDTNCDRVMSMVGCIIGLEETYNLSVRRSIDEDKNSQLKKDFQRLIVNNNKLFRNVK